MASIAIVLNRLGNDSSGYFLLHQKLGKIRCFSQYNKNNDLCVGALVSCTIKKRGKYYVFEDVETDFIPFSAEENDIFFIHNLLKICLEVPFESPVDDVFYHVISVYKRMHTFGDNEKNHALLQLFFLMALFPEDIHLYKIVINPSDLYDEQIGNRGLELCWEKYRQQKMVMQ